MKNLINKLKNANATTAFSQYKSSSMGVLHGRSEKPLSS